jgi:TolB-like protein/DNA-binding winged helix-turn-helix (wHTH) protein/Tfp pilus assembly protein PilF
MNDSTQIASHYLVDDLEIDAGVREVRRGGELLDLPGLSFDLLLVLVRAAPNVLSHDELEKLVWDGRTVSPETMTQRVKLVRDALGDSSESPRYMSVVRGRGYRLKAPVRSIRDETPGEAATPVSSRRPSRLAILLSVIAVLIATLWITTREDSLVSEPGSASQPGAASIAVLAFDDLSENRDQEYFSDAMSETLIRELAQVSGLKVIAKSSSFYFKDKAVRIIDIARELQVGHVLEGSVQKAGNRVRVTAQLIDVSGDSPVWTENFDRDLDDLFAVQDEIAREVVEALKITLLTTEEDRLNQRYRPSLEAYEQLILGRQQVERNTAESMAAAERHFHRAIEIDPGYALAYVGLANTYNFQVRSAGRLIEDSIERRKPLIEKALELDPFSGEAYTARAFLHVDRGDIELAQSDLLKSIELSPNYAQAYQYYGTLLRRQGRFEEALAQIQIAAKLDPIAPFVQSALGSVLWTLGQVEEAQAVTRRNIDRYPELPSNYSRMSYYQAALGHIGEAQHWIDEAWKRNPQGPFEMRWRCIGFLHLGDILSAESCANQLSELHPDVVDTSYVRFWLQVYRGQYESAIATQESVLERLPGWASQTSYLADLVAGQGDLERARRLMADVLPEWLDDEIELAVPDLSAALIFAAILHANGEIERRDILLSAMEEKIATMHRTHGYGYRAMDVYIHAMRGDRDQAIASLREAIDTGWRVYWWMLRDDWKLESLRQDPEFIAMMNELQADIVEQRQWYEENKDKPLF